MNPLAPIDPSSVSALLMENELLRYEVAHLRARLAAATAAVAAAQRAAAPEAPAASESGDAGS